MNKWEYLELLEKWLPAAEKECYSPPGRPDLIAYGSGYSSTWAVQTNLKAVTAFALVGKIRKDSEIMEKAVRMVKYSLATHKTGDFQGSDGGSWGHSWISVLGLERVMHVMDMLAQSFSQRDKDGLRRLLISEADWLFHEYEIVAGLEARTGDNKPESNLWNGAHLYRTAMLYSDAPNRNGYLNKARQFFLNGISVPEDLISKGDDPPKGANFFESYALDHHGYLNVGYMVICLSQVAMLYFWLKENGHPIPQELLSHASELWQLVKSLTFEDGRLWRIGGDTRARYSYCQDYLIPVFQLARDLWHDDVDQLEEGWFLQVKKEQEHNGDGGFLSCRGAKLHNLSPLYYTRLDSDRACSLSMGFHWFDISRKSEMKETFGVLENWSEKYHGALMLREDLRRASFVWKGAEGPVALFLPSGDSSLAEWRHNLTPHAIGQGNLNYYRLNWHDERTVPGGFATAGCYDIEEDIFIAEGLTKRVLLRVYLLYAVLPDGETGVIMQYAESPIRNSIWEAKSLFLQIPNDLFNNGQRIWSWAGEDHILKGPAGYGQVIDTASQSLKLKSNDGTTQLAIKVLYGSESIKIVRPNERQIGFKKYPDRSHRHEQGMLYCDEICLNLHYDRRYRNPGEIIFNCGAALSVTEDFPEIIKYEESPFSKSLTVKDNRDVKYRLTLPITINAGKWEFLEI